MQLSQKEALDRYDVFRARAEEMVKEAYRKT